MAALWRLEADLGRHVNAMAGDLRLLVSLRQGCGSPHHFLGVTLHNMFQSDQRNPVSKPGARRNNWL
jgi:hypothetical protein